MVIKCSRECSGLNPKRLVWVARYDDIDAASAPTAKEAAHILADRILRDNESAPVEIDNRLSFVIERTKQ